jgi:hypothetical protein
VKSARRRKLMGTAWLKRGKHSMMAVEMLVRKVRPMTQLPASLSRYLRWVGVRVRGFCRIWSCKEGT